MIFPLLKRQISLSDSFYQIQNVKTVLYITFYLQTYLKSQYQKLKQQMNIHGFRDAQGRTQNDSRNNLAPIRRPHQNANIFQQMDPLTVDNIRAAETHKVLFISGNRRIKNPKDENYFDMLKDLCCPTFKCFSFTTIVLIVTLVMYIVELIIGLNKAGSFLEVQTSTLLQLGANYAPYIRQGQVYRLIAPIFLHVNFLHFFGNMLAIFMFVTRIEHSFGLVRTFLIYMLSGIGGNIFSALIDSTDVKAGASTSLYGVIGVIIGYMIINWSGLDIVGPIMKYQLCCTSVMIIMFIFFFSVLGTANVDVFGHLGGFLTGLFLSSINETIKNETYEKVIRIVLISLFVIMYVICFAVFFTK